MKIKEITLASLSLNRTGKLANFTQLLTSLKQTYIKKFGMLHWEVRPFEHKELEEMCLKRDVKFSDLKFKPSGLFHNACNAPNCPYFMKVTDEVNLKKHLDGWVGKMPMGFHKFVARHLQKTNEEVFEKLCKDRHFSIELYGVTKEFTFNYIEKVKGFYRQMPEEELDKIVERIIQNDNVVKIPKKPKDKAVKNKKFQGKNKFQVNRGGKGKKRGGH